MDNCGIEQPAGNDMEKYGIWMMNKFMNFLLLLALLAMSGCASLPDNKAKNHTTAFMHVQNSILDALYQAAPRKEDDISGFLLLSDGLDAFVARAVMAQIAEHSIDTQYYMIHGDDVGSLFTNQLLEAADRGVRVRVLLDDINEGRRDLDLALFDRHPNIEVRIFNPFGRNVGRIWQYVTGFGRQTRRAHNKSFTVDGQATILGGRNIGNEYFSRDPELQFQDLDVLAIGPVAQEVSHSFDAYWNHELSYPVSLLVDEALTDAEYAERRKRFSEKISELENSVYVNRLRHSSLANDLKHRNVHLEWAKGKVYADPPDKLLHQVGDVSQQMLTELFPYLRDAKEELIIFSPYFVPGKEGVAFLRQLREKGVRIAILTNSLSSTDVGIVHAGYSRYRKAMLRAGIELWELNKITSKEDRKAWKEGRIGHSKSSLHAKAFIVDRQTLFVGSMNLDPRSVSQNTEIGVIIQAPAMARKIAGEFDKHIRDAAFRLELKKDEFGNESLLWHGRVNGNQTTLTNEPYTSFWQRLGIGVLKWLPIESQI